MADTSVADQRLKQGLFLEAAEAIRPVSAAEAADPWRLALAAEAFERTGRTAEARAAIDEVRRRDTNGSRALVRVLLVQGVLELEHNEADRSIRTLQRTLDLATRLGCTSDAGWVRLRLLLSRFEVDAALDLDAAVDEVLGKVVDAGGPALVGAVHVFGSEMYAKRGMLSAARRHLTLAQDLSRRADNPWLGGLVAIGSFCLSYLDMDYQAAEAAASQALRLSRVSGHLRSEFAAIIDLAHVWMRLGRLEDAGRMLRRASNMCDLSPRCRDSVRDGLAQLEAHKGNLPGGVTLVDEVLASASPRHAYPRVWGALTKAEMLLRQELHAECRAQCESTLAALPVPADTGLRLRLRLILAEALARSGDLAEAGRVAALARQDALDSPVGLLAEVNQRLSHVLSLGGLPLQARALEERARRLAAPSRERRTEPQGARAGGDAASPAAADARDACARVLDRTAAIFEQARRPDLAAAEIGRLLDDLACCRRWAVVHAAAESHTLLDSSDRLTPAELRDLQADPDVVQVSLGHLGDGQITLLAEPQPSIGAIESLSAVARLARHSARAAADGLAAVAGLAVADPRPLDGMRAVLHMARRVADSDLPVLLLGETGVGKEWLARRIHDWSARGGGRFVGFNCAAISRDMIEAQLFGHRKGAFTGAIDGSIGVIRAAEGGTVLLDEIGDMPLECQAKLLRFLETGEVHGVGEVLPRATSVRVLAATNRRAAELTSSGHMREDLYYRLGVVRIEIPPLRRRRDEILPIATEALHRFARESRRPPPTLSARCRDVLLAYDWPGNVRQLVNEMRRAVALNTGGEPVEPGDLSPEVGGTTPVPAPSAAVTIGLDQSLAEAVDALERASIVRALELSQGRREQAAALLGLSRKGLYLKCQRLKVDLPA